MPSMQLTRERYILIGFVCVYIPSNVMLYTMHYNTNKPATHSAVALIVLYVLVIATSVVWTTFALALHPCRIPSRIFPRHTDTHAQESKQPTLFIK